VSSALRVSSDGFCLIVSIVKAQATHTLFINPRVTTRREYPKKSGPSLARFFYLPLHNALRALSFRAKPRNLSSVSRLLPESKRNLQCGPQISSTDSSVEMGLHRLDKDNRLTPCPWVGRIAHRAEKIIASPIFSADSCSLRSALIANEAPGG
jgi:hypothetical protein